MLRVQKYVSLQLCLKWYARVSGSLLLGLALSCFANAQSANPCAWSLGPDGEKHSTCPLLTVTTPVFPPPGNILWKFKFDVNSSQPPVTFAPVTWQLAKGVLPPNTTLALDGTLSGQVTSTKGWNFWVYAQDNGPANNFGPRIALYHVMTPSGIIGSLTSKMKSVLNKIKSVF